MARGYSTVIAAAVACAILTPAFAASPVEISLGVNKDNVVSQYLSSADDEYTGQTAFSKLLGVPAPIWYPEPYHASAYAYGNLEKGILRSYANSDHRYASQGGIVGASGWVTLADTFSFSSTTSTGFAKLHWYVDGEIENGPVEPYPTTAYGRFDILLYSGSQAFQTETSLFAAPGGCSGSLNCVEGNALKARGEIVIPIGPGMSYDFRATLLTQAFWGFDTSFENTARLYLELPQNVTITSGSGVFLAQAAPVPEPSIVAMIIAGLGLVTGIARRRSPVG